MNDKLLTLSKLARFKQILDIIVTGMEEELDNVVNVTATSSGNYYTLSMSPSDIKTALSAGKIVICRHNDNIYYGRSGRTGSQGVYFINITFSSSKTVANHLYCTSSDENGTNTHWRMVSQTLLTASDFKTVNGNTLTGTGNISTENWLVKKTDDGDTSVEFPVANMAVHTHLIVDNTDNGRDVSVTIANAEQGTTVYDGCNTRTVAAGKIIEYEAIVTDDGIIIKSHIIYQKRTL